MSHSKSFGKETIHPAQSLEYTALARDYDIFYQSKGYVRECDFIAALLNKHDARTVLDIGCGTGSHLQLLEERGFDGEGLDANSAMLDIARQKVRGRLTHASMTDFKLGRKFDAIICMFASFNHLLSYEDALKALQCFKSHLNDGGIVLIDLHNPSSDGSKVDAFGNIEREMRWRVDKMRKLELTAVTFKTPDGEVSNERVLRLYSINDMRTLFGAAGFGGFHAYDGYCFEPALPSSKNLEAVGLK